MEITRETCKALSTEIAAALKAIAAKHGLELKINGGSFDATGFKPKVEFLIPGDGNGGTARDDATWKLWAPLYGLDPTLLGKTFTARNGEAFKITGCAPGRSKNCIKVTRVRDNSPRVCPVDFVKAGRF